MADSMKIVSETGLQKYSELLKKYIGDEITGASSALETRVAGAETDISNIAAAVGLSGTDYSFSSSTLEGSTVVEALEAVEARIGEVSIEEGKTVAEGIEDAETLGEAISILATEIGKANDAEEGQESTASGIYAYIDSAVAGTDGAVSAVETRVDELESAVATANEAIESAADAIGELDGLVGKLPTEGTEAETVVDYIDEQVAAAIDELLGEKPEGTPDDAEFTIVGAYGKAESAQSAAEAAKTAADGAQETADSALEAVNSAVELLGEDWSDTRSDNAPATVVEAIEALEEEIKSGIISDVKYSLDGTNYTSTKVTEEDENGVSVTFAKIDLSSLQTGISTNASSIEEINTAIGDIEDLNVPVTVEEGGETAKTLVQAINMNAVAIDAQVAAWSETIGEFGKADAADVESPTIFGQIAKNAEAISTNADAIADNTAAITALDEEVDERISEAIAGLGTAMDFQGAATEENMAAAKPGNVFVIVGDEEVTLTDGQKAQPGDVIIRNAGETASWTVVEKNLDTNNVVTSTATGNAGDIVVFAQGGKVIETSGLQLGDEDLEGFEAETLVGAINELKAAVGATVAEEEGETLGDLMGTDADTVVGAIKEVKDDAAKAQIATASGIAVTAGTTVDGVTTGTALTNLGVASVTVGEGTGTDTLVVSFFDGSNQSEVTVAETMSEDEISDMFDGIFYAEESTEPVTP